ncbi:TPA: hypothetical protein QDB19_002964 [Burkholderia vietnamiensis]|nr:hypothetical protein [Burkholderia vietnamiensis]
MKREQMITAGEGNAALICFYTEHRGKRGALRRRHETKPASGRNCASRATQHYISNKQLDRKSTLACFEK